MLQRLAFPLALLAALSCATPKPSATPQLLATELTPDANGTTRVRFSAPMVDEGAVGQALTELPVTIDPPLPVSAHWEDRATLVLTPTNGAHASTRYTVKLAGPLAKRAGEGPLYFTHKPLELVSVGGGDLERLPPRPTFGLTFNQAVVPAEVAERCALDDGAGGRIALVPAAGSPTARVISAAPASELPRGARFTLTCEGLRGDGGNVGLGAPWDKALRTYPELRLLSMTPDGGDVPADEVKIVLTFSTPVDAELLAKALTSSPKIPGLARGFLDSTGTIYTVEADLATVTAYHVRLASTLTDTFGQKIQGTIKKASYVERSFVTGDARPRLVMERGIFAVEAAAAGYPVWVRNLKSYELTCAAIPKDKLVTLLTSDMNYDPWYDASEGQTIDWPKYGASPSKVRRQIPQAKNKWQLEELKLPGLCGGKSPDARGVVLAELRSDEVKPDKDTGYGVRPFQRVLANVTDLGVLTKIGPASGLVWVTTISGGKPVAGAQVSIYKPQDGSRVWEGKTDAQGLAKVPGSAVLLAKVRAGDKDALEEDPETEYDGWRDQRLIVIVEQGQDLAVVDGNWQNGIQIWNFGVPEDRGGGVAKIRALIQSDRGIYRPGETAHVKGIVRAVRLGRAPEPPRQKVVKVHIEDARGQSVMEEERPLSAFGGFALDVPIAEGAPVGDYLVSATIDGQTIRDHFQVEEFRKLEMELELAGRARHVALGTPVEANLEGRYLFGAPVAGGEVTWTAERRAHPLIFPRFEDYTFDDEGARAWGWWGRGGDDYPSFVSDGVGVLDAKGRLTISFSDGEKKLDGPQDYLIQATVKDETDRPISARTMITGHRSDFYFGVHAQEFVQAVDMPFAVNAIAVDQEGRRIAGQGTLSWIQERRECEAGVRPWERWGCKTIAARQWSRAVTVPATGSLTERILPKAAGDYLVKIEGKDAHGQPVVASTRIWVIGRGEAFWSGDESARLGLVAGKTTYLPGETARLALRTPIASGTALITLERNGVLDARVVTMASTAEGISIPLTDAHAPNVFGSVALVRGRTAPGDEGRPAFQMGVIDLEVSAAKQGLDVAISLPRSKVKPGETVTGTIKVTAGGLPVSSEIALSVADEGVLQLVGYQTPDPMKAFYAKWGLGVDAATSWNRIAKANDPREIDPDEGGDAGGDVAMRSRFVSSAFWAPALVTDAKGEAKFQFVAPDDLTAFRVMAVVADRGSRFGHADTRVTIAKPVVLTAVLPRFLAESDRPELGAVIRNYTSADGEAVVTAKATGITLSATERRVRVPAGGSARVRFPAVAGAAATARVELVARLGTESDGVRIDLPVTRPLAIDQVVLASARVEGTAKAALAWAPEVLAADSRVEILVDRTGLADVGPSLRELVEYPYGCLEQTLSRFVPLTKVRDLATSLKLKDLEGPKMRTFLAAGVNKVLRHQHDDGHFSLWPAGPTYPHLTAYALWGLGEAKRAGVAVPDEPLGRGASALKKWVNDPGRTLEPGNEAGTLAMAAYVLGTLGHGDASLNARLYAARAGLPIYGQAFLLRAMAGAKARKADLDTLRRELEARVVVRGAAATVAEKDPRPWEVMSSNVRSTAMVLSALVEVAPESPLIPKLVDGLREARRPTGAWSSTQENVWSLVAMADVARRAAVGRAEVTVKLGDAVLEKGAIEGGATLTVARRLDQVKPGLIALEASTPVRWTVRVTTARKIADDPAIARGFTVSRRYVDVKSGQVIERVAAGQLVKVIIDVVPARPQAWVAVDDPLPAGFEPVQQGLATSEEVQGAQSQAGTWRGWDHLELRDQRALAFADRLSAPTQLTYLARATLPGKFTAPGTTALAMYDDGVRGRGASQTIEVDP